MTILQSYNKRNDTSIMQGPRTNAAGWAQAGRDAGKSYASIAETTRKYSPRYDELAEVGLKARSQEKQAAIAAESKARQAEIAAETTLKKADIAIDKFESINKSKGTIRKAGMVAAAGSAIGMALIPDEEPIRPEQISYDASEEKIKASLDSDRAKLAELPSVDEPGPRSETGAEAFKNTPDGGATNTETGGQPGKVPTPSTGGFKFSPQATKGLAEIRRVESGPYGYDAYNLGGRTEFEPVGSGSAKDNRFGKPLTQMTIGEIKQLGKSGKIHATGAYQFTHNTGSFGEAAQFAGLSDNDIFSPANQDRMAYEFGRKYGWDRWSGLKKDEKARNAAILGFQN